ncbi:unnamed protein product, partial [Owenia fusiformis]
YAIEIMEVENEKVASKTTKKSKKKAKEPGIIYFSRIPTYMSVKKIRQIFSVYGELDRIFLQPDERAPEHKKNRVFSEGWIEFKDKKIAKQVAVTLNNKQIGGKRRSPWYEEVWMMKYLHRFKWAHLNERLAYESAVHTHRMRTEIAQVKKETNFYIDNIEKRKAFKRIEKKKERTLNLRPWEFHQAATEDEIQDKKRKRKGVEDEKVPEKKKQKGSDAAVGNNKSFMKRIFSGGLQADDSDDES